MPSTEDAKAAQRICAKGLGSNYLLTTEGAKETKKSTGCANKGVTRLIRILSVLETKDVSRAKEVRSAIKEVANIYRL